MGWFHFKILTVKKPDLVKGKQKYSYKILLKRLMWSIVWNVLIRPLPHFGFIKYVNFWYRLFGAKIGKTSGIYPSARVFMPWNIIIGEYSAVGQHVDVYNASPVIIGDVCVISERAYLCTASHNIHSKYHEQVSEPIILKNRSWIAAEAFVGMGVTIGEGAVVGARAAVFKDVEPWTVVGGNPARVIKRREIVD